MTEYLHAPSSSRTPGHRWTKVFLWIGSAAAILALVLLLRRHHPSDLPFIPQCPVWTWLGLHCPGCGTGRALHALVNGRWDAAWRFNLLATAALPFMALLLWDDFRERPWLLRRAGLGWWVLGVVLVYTVLRNLPWEPFSWLAPGG